MQSTDVHFVQTGVSSVVSSCFQKLRLTLKGELSSSPGSILQPLVMLRRGCQEIRQKRTFNIIKRILCP